MLNSNIGLTDRALRIYALIALLIAVISGISPPWLAIISVYAATTALTAWEPLYALLGISSKKAGKQSPETWAGPNIKITEQVVRISLAIVMLITGMTLATSSVITFYISYLLLLPVILTVTAITAWDPIYAAVYHWHKRSSAEVLPLMPKPAAPPQEPIAGEHRKAA